MERLIVGSTGRPLDLERAPQRIVSLVPSWTETLFALDRGSRLVGVTDYCAHPAEGVARIPRVGGTKNPSLEAILALGPDLVIANREENRRRDVERLEASGVPVWVTEVCDLEAALAGIESLGAWVDARAAADRIVREARGALAAVETTRREPPPRVVALIWKHPFMAVGGDTYADALIRSCGGRNPLARCASRYPRIDARALAAVEPQVVLLPSEPYAFTEEDRLELEELPFPAARSGRIHRIEGELLSWYGPRMARALRTLAPLILGAG